MSSPSPGVLDHHAYTNTLYTLNFLVMLWQGRSAGVILERVVVPFLTATLIMARSEAPYSFAFASSLILSLVLCCEEYREVICALIGAETVHVLLTATGNNSCGLLVACEILFHR